MKFSFLTLLILISFSISAKKTESYHDELYRPQFHFSPEKNWMGEPGGLVYYAGEYHLFYQYNPEGKEPGNIQWGHAVSQDLIRWEYLPFALNPDDDKNSTILSGSGIVDYNNVTGLQSGDEKTILLFYTLSVRGQMIAYSNDKGRTWKKYEQSPVLVSDPDDEIKNPRVFWYQPGKHFVMVLSRKQNKGEKFRGTSFYTSTDLLHWKFGSNLPYFTDKPDMVELPVNNRDEDKKWVLFDAEGNYLIGSFDGERFTAESARIQGDFGNNYYAVQTWNDIPDSQGKVKQIAWMNGANFPEMDFSGQLTFPSELTLKKFSDGIVLIRRPIKEIENLHEKGHIWENKNLIPGLNKNLLSGIKGDCFHIKATFKLKTANSISIFLRLDKQKNGAEILYDTQSKVLGFMTGKMILEPVDETIKLDILIDRSSVEIFANDGRNVLSNCFLPKKDALGLYLNNTGGEMLVEKLEIYPLKSIWEEEKKD
jgi:sucrose-6-phosphate hydrolase SacC (GH32 family)